MLDLAGNNDGILGPMTIENFGGAAVWLTGNDDALTGDTFTGNAGDGVDVMGDNAILSRNEITANGGDGVSVTGNDNAIGAPLENPLSFYDGGNWLAGNGQDGVNIWGGASGNLVQDNLIGTDYGGTGADANAASGVSISNSPGNTIGGTVQGAGNLISGNAGDGISIGGSSSTNDVVQANKIGTDASGTLPLGNGNRGIGIYGASEDLIGGTQPGAGNRSRTIRGKASRSSAHRTISSRETRSAPISPD